MIKHYLKIAFRNLLKYKVQSIISIVGLAIGFTCFALSAMWMHYEMTYDSQYDGTDRLYLLYKKSVFSNIGYSTGMPYPASTMLKNDFPEVEDACALRKWFEMDMNVEGEPAIKVYEMQADSCFMKMFHISVLAGSMEFMYSDEKVALTEETAIQLFGSTEVIGKEVILQNAQKVTVCAILKNMEHSNFAFGYWGKGKDFRQWQNNWTNGGFQIIVRLRQGVDVAAFQKKLSMYDKKGTSEDYKTIFEDVQLLPLSKYHYSVINENKSVDFYYLILFSVVGGLVILCSLFNYLSLFVIRMQMRSREIELRKVCGSSIHALFTLFGTEYLCMILVAGLLGMTLVEVALPAFRDMSGIAGSIYLESLLYFAGLLLLSLLLLVPFLIRKSHIQKAGRRQFLLRKASIILQLGIGILFIFCTVVIIKQIYFLTNTDLGWERKNMATISYLYPSNDFKAIADKIKQFPCAKEVITVPCAILPATATIMSYYDNWDGKEDDAKPMEAVCLYESEKIIQFYHLELLDGRIPGEKDQANVVINQAAAKVLNMHNPVGKKLHQESREVMIVGLIKDFHATPPTTPVQPFILNPGKLRGFPVGMGQIVIKYQDGKWGELRNKIDEMFIREYPGVEYKLEKTEDVYAGYLKSEKIVLKLLSFIAGVCVLIAAFGIFSLVTLSCEQRRKEVVIRKVNGATVGDILKMFIKEYMSLLVITIVVTFPIGYALMKKWLENYVEQTAISAWIYVVIFVGIALVVMLCIGWRVWQTARQNPAEVVKNE